MNRLRPTVQHYDRYLKEDIKVWRLLFDCQMSSLKSRASSIYLESAKKIGFNAANIPHFFHTSRILLATTGWQLKVVPELVPQAEFFQSLAKRVFPATCWLRTFQELNYIEEPDMFHDVFGHVPLLMDPSYALFMEGFAKLALKWLDRPEAISLLGNFYWFTVEFGLIMEHGAIKIYGAGILSSRKETVHSLSSETVRLPFDIAEMLTTSYRTDILQERYFVINSFEQLYQSLPGLEQSLIGILERNVVRDSLTPV